MELFFNNAGPCIPDDHYMIDPLRRIDHETVEDLIAEKRYFVLHAPRQTGKTSCLLALMHHLNDQGRYQALYVNVEAAQAHREDIPEAMRTICYSIADNAEDYLQDTRLTPSIEALLQRGTGKALQALLRHWASINEKPVVLFIDEIDALIGDTLVSVLRQIRAGYAQRPHKFPLSIVLCGVRDVRDYRMEPRHKEVITGGSAFNIKAVSLRLGNFSQAEVRELWAQHTIATGQTFAEAIYPELWADTQGQPWLVNALGYQLTRSPEFRYLRDRTIPITLTDYQAAREILIQSRATHLDQLSDKLKEPRVHAVISALLSGTQTDKTIPLDNLNYVEDLGLIQRHPVLSIANRIYQEVIPRDLTYTAQYMLPYQQAWYLTPQRRLDIPKLLKAFQHYFQEHSEAWIDRFDYKEAGPQLLLQAFLQRIVNGGGRIAREYGLGRRRTDLYIEWPVDEQAGYHGEVQRIVLELKIRYQSKQATIEKGLAQTADYADKSAADEAHLLIFDCRPEVAWKEKIWQQNHTHAHRTLGVWGL